MDIHPLYPDDHVFVSAQVETEERPGWYDLEATIQFTSRHGSALFDFSVFVPSDTESLDEHDRERILSEARALVRLCDAVAALRAQYGEAVARFLDLETVSW